MLEIGDRVYINIPLQAAFLKNAKAKRRYNHKAAQVINIIEDRYLLSVDCGKFEWDERVLAKLVRRE